MSRKEQDTAEPPLPKPPATVGKYRVDVKIGAGSFGTIYRGTNITNGEEGLHIY